MLFRPSYHSPTKISEALSLLAEKPYAKIIAGGTDLLVKKPPQVKNLIDITYLGLNYIKNDADSVRIGACTTISDIEDSKLLENEWCGMLKETAQMIAVRRTKNIATIGGNICNAAPSADLLSALIALDAKAKVVSLTKEKVVLLEDFCLGPGKTILKGDEILLEIQIPHLPYYTGAAFCKIGRTQLDIALVNVAVRVTLGSNDICEDARIALGAVAPTPIRTKKAETLIKGKIPENAILEEVAKVAAEETKPISDVRTSAQYRKKMSKVLVKRALKKALNRIQIRREIF